MNKQQEELIARLKRIEGQARGIQRMIEDERDCQQILTQLTAMRNATNKVSMMLVRSYAAECLLDAANVPDVDNLITLIAKAAS
jgi:DNA-binding FrmR family transcriptional regulator